VLKEAVCEKVPTELDFPREEREILAYWKAERIFEKSLEEGFLVDLLVLHLVGQRDVTGEIGEDDAPGEGVVPGAAADADMLALLGDPDAEDFEGGLVALGDGWNAQYFLGTHDLMTSWKSLQCLRDGERKRETDCRNYSIFLGFHRLWSLPQGG